FAQLPPNWREGINEPPGIDDLIGVDYDAREFYAKKAGDAETWIPELAARSPSEKMAKAVAVLGPFEQYRAKLIVLGWQRAQIANQGINPDTGANLIDERQ